MQIILSKYLNFDKAVFFLISKYCEIFFQFDIMCIGLHSNSTIYQNMRTMREVTIQLFLSDNQSQMFSNAIFQILSHICNLLLHNKMKWCSTAK